MTLFYNDLFFLIFQIRLFNKEKLRWLWDGFFYKGSNQVPKTIIIFYKNYCKFLFTFLMNQ